MFGLRKPTNAADRRNLTAQIALQCVLVIGFDRGGPDRTASTGNPNTSRNMNAAPSRRPGRIQLLLAIGCLQVLTMSAHAENNPLASLRWKERVLVVVGPTDQADARTQNRIFKDAAAGMSERDVTLVDASGADPGSVAIRKSLSVSNKQFAVFLVGKDGNVALSSDKPLTADYLFQRIDAMPMRQDEIHRRK
jgi:hypothetical protein